MTGAGPPPAAPPTGEGVVIRPLRGIPEITAGDDLAAHLVAALRRSGTPLVEGDVLAVSSKVVSKAAGLRAPAAQRAGLVLAESRAVVAERMSPGGLTRIVRSRSGPVLAGAGIDASNVGRDGDHVLLLPRDPDAAAAALRAGVVAAVEATGGTAPARWGLLLTDTAGRPWRVGLADIAIGAAGMPVLADHRGGRDADGRPLAVTVRALADELAAAADLVKGKVDGVPAAVISGLPWPGSTRPAPQTDAGPSAPVSALAAGGATPPAGDAPGTTGDATPPAGDAPGPTGDAPPPTGDAPGPEYPGAAALVREGAADWFSLGTAEAVRAALGAPPGTHAAVDVGIPDAGGDDMDERVARACRLARLDGLGVVPAGHPRERLAGPRPDPGAARLDVVQFGVQVEGPDALTVGVVVGRLLVALAGEGVPAAWARTEPAADGRGPRAFVLFTGD